MAFGSVVSLTYLSSLAVFKLNSIVRTYVRPVLVRSFVRLLVWVVGLLDVSAARQALGLLDVRAKVFPFIKHYR